MDERISLEQEPADSRPSKGPLLALGIVAAVLVGFFAVADFSGADRSSAEAPSVATTSPSTTRVVSTVAEISEVIDVDRALRNKSFSKEDLDGSDVEWVTVDLAPDMTEVAGIGEFQGSVVVVGGRMNEAGLFEGLRMTGRSAFDTWFDVGTVTDEPISVTHIAFSPGVMVVAGRSRPTADAIRGDIVIFQSTNGKDWSESRIPDRNGTFDVSAIALERQSVTVFGVWQIVSDTELADELSDAVRQLIATGSARAVGFDGQILLLGPFGIELARYPSTLVPADESTGELLLEFRSVAWTSEIGGEMVETPSPFGDGIADTVSRNSLGDLTAQVYVRSNYEEWFSLGDGSWEHRSTYPRTPAQGVGSLEEVGLFFDPWALRPRILAVEAAVPYLLDFDRTSGSLLDVFANSTGVVVPTRRVTTPRVLISDVSTYDDGATTIEVDRRVARITVTDVRGVVYSNEIYNITPSRVDLTNGRFMIAADDGSDLIWIDLLLLRPTLDEDEIQLAAGVLTSIDLQSWTYSDLPEFVEVTSAYVSNKTYLVVRRWVDSAPEPMMLLVAPTP